MQELAGDRVGEGCEGHRLLLPIKEVVHPNPGVECCGHARYRRWSSYFIGDWRHKKPRRSVDGAWPSQSSPPVYGGPRVTRNLVVAGFLFVSFDNLSRSAAPLTPYCALG